MRTAFDVRLAWAAVGETAGEPSPGAAGAPSARQAPIVEPPLPPRAEAIVLLQAVAEVEHALMVQYLYAAYSLVDPDGLPDARAALVRRWRDALLGIAREEMGHLLTVQNVLRFLGGAINLERQGYPFRSALYPFPFSLEPASRQSIAKYVLAEMPEHPDDDLADVHGVLRDAGSSPTTSPQRIGYLYDRVIHLLETIDEGECRADARYLDGLQRLWHGSESILIPPVSSLAAARAALGRIEAQGEGLSEADGLPSHFRRLLAVFRELPAGDEWPVARAVPTDPTLEPPAGGAPGAPGDNVLTHPGARAWAQMLNLRYGALLAYLGHALMLDASTPASAESVAMRAVLVDLAFREMRLVATVARLVTTLPRRAAQHADDAARAGPPFELPITLDLPDRQVDLWRGHRDVVHASETLRAVLASIDAGGHGDVVAALAEADRAALAECDRQIARWREDPRAPVFIAGAGPAGLAAAMTLASRGVPVRVFECSPLLGGKVNSHYEADRSFEHGVHGWWMNYRNFDRLLREAGVDPVAALKEADGSNVVLPDGRRTALELLPVDVPSPLFLAVQVLRSPFLGVRDLLAASRFFIHVVAFDHARDYDRYDGFSFQRLMDHCGVSARFQELTLRPFILSFDFTTPDRVSAACGLSGTQFYILPDQRSILARWSRRIPAVTVYEPIGRAIERQGGTITRETSVLSVTIERARVRGITVGATPAAGSAAEVVARVPLGAVPTDGYVKVQTPGAVLWAGRTGGQIRVLDARCPHMGCSAEWSSAGGQFVCPCHGSRFDSAGAVTNGPATRGLRVLDSREDAGSLLVLDAASADAVQPCGDVILATDLEAAKRVLRDSPGAPEGLLRDLDRLDTCPVIVVRLWFRADVGPTAEESVVAAGLPFIDNFFNLNRYDLDAPLQGEVVEVQAYRVDALIDRPDEEILALALADVGVINPRLARGALTFYTINRHRKLFTRYGPGQNAFRPAGPTEVAGLYLAGDWTRAEHAVWMQERAVVSGIRAANAVLRRRGLPEAAVLMPPPDHWFLRASRWFGRALRRTWLGRLPS